MAGEPQVGLVEWVQEVPARSFTTAEVGADETVIAVNSAAVFADAEQVSIDGLPYTVAAVDVDASTITLGEGLVSDVDELFPVDVYPEKSVRYATVRIDDATAADAGDLVTALVPHVARIFAALDVGLRDLAEREQVSIGGWPDVQILDVLNDPPSIDGGIINPDTTIPVAALTDGTTPDSSPTPDLAAFAVGGLRWQVSPIPNDDPIRFRVYADTTDPPTIDADHLVADTASHSGTFAAINDVPLLPDLPTDPIPTYYVAVVEYDADGDADLSATSAGAAPRRAAVAEISADWAYLGNIEANQITAGTFTADIALVAKLAVGNYIDIDGDSSSITIYADPEHTQPLVQLRPDGSVFRGQVIADDVSVLNGLILQGTGSHIAQDAGITVDASIIDPSTAPTLAVGPEVIAFPTLPAGYSLRGFAWDAVDSCWIRLISNATHTVKLQKISGSPLAVTATITMGVSTESNLWGLTRLGSNYFSLGVYGLDEAGANNRWRVHKWSTAGALVARSDEIASTVLAGCGNPGIGNDGTDLLVAIFDEFGGSTYLYEYSPSTLAYTGTAGFLNGQSASITFAGHGSFDFGSDRLCVSYAGDVRIFDPGTETENADEAFTTASWPAWDGTAFYAHWGAAFLYKYNSHYPAASEKAWVTYTDTDTGSAKHTKDSPVVSIDTVARNNVYAFLPPAPTGATTPRVYMALATSAPADTALLLRPETITNRVGVLHPETAGGIALVHTATVTNRELTSNVAKLTTSAAHSLEVGDTITVASVPTDTFFNGTFVITAKTSTTVSYALVHANVASTSSTGTVTNTDTNTFGTGTAAWIKSQLDGWELKGDGTATFGADILTKSQWQGVSSSANPTSTTNITLSFPSAFTLVSRGTADVFQVFMDADVRMVTAGSVNIIECLVDGSAEAVQLITSGAAGTRIPGHKEWRITGLSAGSHTVTFRTRNTAGSTNVVVDTHTIAGWKWAQ